MKKTITISFLGILFFSQIGYYFFYRFQQHEIKEAAKHALLATLPESSLQIIDANTHKEDIEWQEEDKAFYLHGQMYDVACIKVINGKQLIYCLNDGKKEDLMQELANLVDYGNKQSSSNKYAHHIIKFHLSYYTIPAQHAVIAMNEWVLVPNIDRIVTLVNNVTEILTPPPDLTLKNKTCQL